MNIICIPPLLTRENLRPEIPYHYINLDHEGFAWSPDGAGCYFYDSQEEMEDQHGDEQRPWLVRLHPDF